MTVRRLRWLVIHLELLSNITSLIKEEVKTLALTFYSFPSLPFPSLPFPSHSYVIDKGRSRRKLWHSLSIPSLPFSSLPFTFLCHILSHQMISYEKHNGVIAVTEKESKESKETENLWKDVAVLYNDGDPLPTKDLQHCNDCWVSERLWGTGAEKQRKPGLVGEQRWRGAVANLIQDGKRDFKGPDTRYSITCNRWRGYHEDKHENKWNLIG